MDFDFNDRHLWRYCICTLISMACTQKKKKKERDTMSQHLHTWSVSGTVKFSTWPFSFHSVLSCMLGTCTLTATGPWRGKRQNDSRLINLREWNEHRCYRPNFTAKSTYITKEVGFLMEKYVYCKNIHRTFHGSKKKPYFYEGTPPLE